MMLRCPPDGSVTRAAHAAATADDNRLQYSISRSLELKSEWQELSQVYLPHVGSRPPWRYSRQMSAMDARQGWKIHLSATILSACDVLRAVGPVLRERGIPFKGPASLDELRKLNSGIWYGYTQTGKSLTVYPASRDSFIALCRELDSLTRGLATGPAIPFDIRYSHGSNVYYRYGTFVPRKATTADTRDLVFSPSGEVMEDRRDTPAKAPPWEEDPFSLSRSTGRSSVSSFLEQFKVFRTLTQRGKGGTYEAIDMAARPLRQCIIKEGRRHGETGWDGRDGYGRIRNEGTILSALGKQGPFVPRVHEMREESNNAYLVLEKLEGLTLERFLTGFPRPLEERISLHLARQLAALVAKVHSCGFVWRDCTPSNLIVGRDGRLRAIDFEGSCRISEFEPVAWSTPDYSPPEVRSGYYLKAEKSNTPEDLFALGCCLYLLFEGRSPFLNHDYSRSPAFDRLKGARIAKIITRLLSVEPDLRPDAAAVSKCLRPKRATSYAKDR